MGLLIFWIVCGIFSAILASSKGRGGCGWFVIGTLFGPLGFLLVAFMPALPKDEEEATIETQAIEQPSDERKCPFCAEMIKKEAIVCKHCGRDVEPEKPEEEKPAEIIVENTAESEAEKK